MSVGRLQVSGGKIGHTVHEGREGWTFNVLWEPGMPDETLAALLVEAFDEGAKERSRHIGRLLGVVT